ncbi:MAG: hypothetical protein ABSD67_00105 [Terracidiphilus sp.]|jgi:hypothetical protein
MRNLTLLLILAASAMRAIAADRITVEQLQKVLAAVQTRPDQEVARQLGNLELTERLSTTRFEILKAGLPEDNSRQALLALADASAFLDLPAADILPISPPDSATQGRILSQAADFVTATINRMPDFFATRTTTRFEDLKVKFLFEQPVVAPDRSFHLVDKVGVNVLYRNGREVVEAPGAKKAGKTLPFQKGLSNWGVFGPLLGVVMTDILKNKVGWSHWERDDYGPLAVFRFVVTEQKSNYSVTYCCFLEYGIMSDFKAVPPYHGEIAIDSASGAVRRLVVKTDLKPELLVSKANVLVEYSPVEIGGKVYICPAKSVSIVTAIDQLLTEDGDQVMNNEQSYHNGTIETQKVTAINDVLFGNYHAYRGDMRILPTDSSEQNRNAPAP